LKNLLRIIAPMALIVMSLGTLPVRANHDETGVDHAFADSAFEDRWERLDRPVAGFGVGRTFWWGPGPYTPGLMQAYEQSPGKQRLVQYFDKSRMEINDPHGDPDELWYVTNGLLVVEMIEGKIQIGDASYRDAEPANVPVAGDPNNPYGPTYATLAQRLDEPARDQDTLIADRIDRAGNVTYEPALNDYEIATGTYVPETDHSIAAPFWDVMNSSGTIWVDGELVIGPMFQNPFYAVGYPVTEPYWSTAVVAGVEQDVLLQCFERRCLTYTPGNQIGFRVEAGNVGQHHYRWINEQGGEQPDTETVKVFFVALEDNGENGDLVGCGDSLVPVEVEIAATDDPGVRLVETLNALFETGAQTVTGPDGHALYNALANSEITVLDAEVSDGLATVHLAGEVSIGGVCDEQRFVEQLRQTVLQFDGIQIANVFLNGQLLRGYFGPERLDSGVLATFDVNGELIQLWSTNPETIDQIMALAAGTSSATIPNGPLLRGSGTANYNLPWSWHLDPALTRMAEVTVEVCDAAPSFVEANLDYFVDSVGRYCPWSAELIHVEDLRSVESR
jgi:Sporulation and spore germination